MRVSSARRWAGLLLLVLLPLVIVSCDKEMPPEPERRPAAPSELSAEIRNNTDILLRWQDNSSDEDGFEIHESLTPTDNFGVLRVTESNVDSVLLINKDDSFTYYYKVYSVKGDLHSTPSNTASCQILSVAPPAAPSALNAEDITESTVDLSWQDNSNNEIGFYLERQDTSDVWELIAEKGEDDTLHQDTGLPSGAEFSYRVQAYNSVGTSSMSNTITITTLVPTVPNAPSALAASNITATSAVLSWQDNSNNEFGFRLDRKLSTGSWANIAEVGSNAETYTDSGLQPNSAYAYRVQSFNQAGESSWSNEAQVQTPDNSLITVIYPNGGESFSPGEQVNVNWDAEDSISHVKIRLYKGDIVWDVPAGSTSNDGFRQVYLPYNAPAGSDYRIHISDTDNDSVFDFSDDYFTITD